MSDLLRPMPSFRVSGPGTTARCVGSHVVACAALTLLTGTSLAAQSPAERTPPASIGVDVTITHSFVDATGTLVSAAATPPTRFRLQRVHGPSGWVTVLRYRVSSDGATGPEVNPLDGARIEYLDGARGIRVYDRDGHLNPHLSGEPASGSGLPVFDGTQRWMDTLLPDPRSASERRRELAQRFGAPVDQVNSLDRYVVHEGNATEEVLADADGLILEDRRTRDGVVDRLTTFDYGTLPDGRMARRAIRIEEPFGDNGHRSVVTVTLSNPTTGTER